MCVVLSVSEPNKMKRKESRIAKEDLEESKIWRLENFKFTKLTPTLTLTFGGFVRVPNGRNRIIHKTPIPIAATIKMFDGTINRSHRLSIGLSHSLIQFLEERLLIATFLFFRHNLPRFLWFRFAQSWWKRSGRILSRLPGHDWTKLLFIILL